MTFCFIYYVHVHYWIPQQSHTHLFYVIIEFIVNWDDDEKVDENFMHIKKNITSLKKQYLITFCNISPNFNLIHSIFWWFNFQSLSNLESLWFVAHIEKIKSSFRARKRRKSADRNQQLQQHRRKKTFIKLDI